MSSTEDSASEEDLELEDLELELGLGGATSDGELELVALGSVLDEAALCWHGARRALPRGWRLAARV